jgi:hypothetical protein
LRGLESGGRDGNRDGERDDEKREGEEGIIRELRKRWYGE